MYFLWLLALIPRIIFNLDFTPLLYNSIPLCITPNMSPLGAISFWYVIGFYPLFLLLLIYVWIVLYDKGFRCVVCITRPFHRCMARFWSMTGIEPSLTHSIASIYILCYTQLAVVSFKILSFTHTDSNSTVFFFDAKQEYFKGFHALAGSFAILVLLFLILLPTLYIQFYPFKWFHKLLDFLKLRKQLLISLGDVFTGPYKNGSDNTFDYRYTCGLFLLARLIIMFQLIFASSYILFAIILSFAQMCLYLLALIIIIFHHDVGDTDSIGGQFNTVLTVDGSSLVSNITFTATLNISNYIVQCGPVGSTPVNCSIVIAGKINMITMPNIITCLQLFHLLQLFLLIILPSLGILLPSPGPQHQAVLVSLITVSMLLVLTTLSVLLILV